MEGDVYRRSFAELVGAFALTFIGAGAVMTASGNLLVVAGAHAIILAVMVCALGHISGGHFNPAVTFGFLITGRIVPLLAVMYWAAQFLGATLAALLLRWIYPDAIVKASKLGAPALSSQIGVAPGLVLEIVMTFFLVWVVFATAADPRGAFKSISGFRHRPHDRSGHPHGRAFDRRCDEPCPCLRAAARRECLGRRLDLVHRPTDRWRGSRSRVRIPLSEATPAGSCRAGRDGHRGTPPGRRRGFLDLLEDRRIEDSARLRHGPGGDRVPNRILAVAHR